VYFLFLASNNSFTSKFIASSKIISFFLERIAYTMIFSGAVGNMIDRLFRGFVIDMLDFRGIWSFIFNFADVWINIGVILIIIEHLIFNRKKRVK